MGITIIQCEQETKDLFDDIHKKYGKTNDETLRMICKYFNKVDKGLIIKDGELYTIDELGA